jgi:hypothetical protein
MEMMFAKAELCSVILDTGYMGTPAEYLTAYHSRDIDKLSLEDILKLTEEIRAKRGWFWEFMKEAERDTL